MNRVAVAEPTGVGVGTGLHNVLSPPKIRIPSLRVIVNVKIRRQKPGRRLFIQSYRPDGVLGIMPVTARSCAAARSLSFVPLACASSCRQRFTSLSTSFPFGGEKCLDTLELTFKAFEVEGRAIGHTVSAGGRNTTTAHGNGAGALAPPNFRRPRTKRTSPWGRQ